MEGRRSGVDREKERERDLIQKFKVFLFFNIYVVHYAMPVAN